MKRLLSIFTALWSLPALASAQVGNPAPNFTATDTHGKIHTLYNYLDSGKVVVLDFFYTTCGPCQFYSPQVNLAYEKYGCNTQKVVFMSIDYDDTNAEVQAYDQQFAIEYPSISGLNGGGNAIVNLYHIEGFPTFYVIDSTRTIIEKIDPPTLQVFDYRFNQHGIQPAPCLSTPIRELPVKSLSVFPNPSIRGEPIAVGLPEATDGKLKYEIRNLTGQLFQKGSGLPDASGRVTIEPGPLPAGVYFLQCRNNRNGFSGKFVVR